MRGLFLSRARALVLVWALIAAASLGLQWHALATHSFIDVDDIMRLMEVRDWLAGQSWWDMSQHRVGPAPGLAMHWSRLLDVPLAALIASARPLVGGSAAEVIAVAAVPLLTLAAAICGVALAVKRLIGPQIAPAALAAVLLVSAPAVYVQIHPGRIDHHGWQIALGGLAFAWLLDPRPIRGGLLAGAATALFLHVSMEGLPFAAAAAGVTGLLWAFRMDRAERLVAFLGALAAASLLLFLLVRPAPWASPWCDVVLPQHLLAFAAATAATALAAFLGERLGPPVRLALLGGAGLAAGGVLASTAHQCLAGPFGALPPLATRLWLHNVNEGLPIWRQGVPDAFTIIGFPIVGLLGSAWRVRQASPGEERRGWLLTLLLLAATTLTGMLVRRAAGLPHLLAVPGALAIIEPLRTRAVASPSVIVRVLGAAFAILLFSPLMQLCLAAAVSPSDPDGGRSRADRCNQRCGLAAIGRRPPALVFTDIDLGPRLLMASSDRIYTAGYHRSGAPMERTLTALTSPPDRAKAIVRASGAGYLLIAPDSPESKVYAAYAPRGLVARLAHGEVPAWLQPIETGSHDISYYRVLRPPSVAGAR